MGGTRDWWEGDVIGGGGTRLVRGHVIGGQETRNWAVTQLIGGRRDWWETQLVGGTHDWWEGDVICERDMRLVRDTTSGRDTQLVGTKTPTVSEPLPSLPGIRRPLSPTVLASGHRAIRLLVPGGNRN